MRCFIYLDEVSENEKLSSVSSDTGTSASVSSLGNSDNNKNYLISEEKKENLKNSENQLQSEADTQMSQIDADLLEYMTEFKLFTDGFVSEWFKTLSFSTAEIQEYLGWLENKGEFLLLLFLIVIFVYCRTFLRSTSLILEYKRIWTNIHNNARKKSGTGDDNVDNEYYLNVSFCYINLKFNHFLHSNYDYLYYVS